MQNGMAPRAKHCEGQNRNNRFIKSEAPVLIPTQMARLWLPTKWYGSQWHSARHPWLFTSPESIFLIYAKSLSDPKSLIHSQKGLERSADFTWPTPPCHFSHSLDITSKLSSLSSELLWSHLPETDCWVQCSVFDWYAKLDLLDPGKLDLIYNSILLRAKWSVLICQRLWLVSRIIADWR